VDDVRIVDARVERVGGAVVGTARSATERWPERWGAWLRLRDDQGCEGWGEASPLPGRSPETLEQAEACLRSVPWSEVATGDDARHALDAIRDLLTHLPASVPSARFAAETALLDLLGKRCGLPVHRLLVPDVEAFASVPSCALLPGDDVAAEARAAAAAGFATLKLKVGAGPAEGVARVRAVREAVGDTVALRLDANGALPEADWAQVLDRLAPHSPELVEEPVSASRVAEAWGAGWRSPVPLAADESLANARARKLVRTLTAAGAYGAWVLKPAELGGLLACLELAREAKTLGADAIVSHLFDGPIARAASAELALALGGSLAAGLGPHAGLTSFPLASAASVRAAHVVPHAEPGLGLCWASEAGAP
jgi:o-succinylbenzoate synthase